MPDKRLACRSISASDELLVCIVDIVKENCCSWLVHVSVDDDNRLDYMSRIDKVKVQEQCVLTSQHDAMML